MLRGGGRLLLVEGRHPGNFPRPGLGARAAVARPVGDAFAVRDPARDPGGLGADSLEFVLEFAERRLATRVRTRGAGVGGYNVALEWGRPQARPQARARGGGGRGGRGWSRIARPRPRPLLLHILFVAALAAVRPKGHVFGVFGVEAQGVGGKRAANEAADATHHRTEREVQPEEGEATARVEVKGQEQKVEREAEAGAAPR
mmetsp:Transcript_10355/g.23979  ORF Transcript_10355/g.23979 Transcript_10355/m.23979 type:complete len:202 (-) Transcript_10355:511-1116(-)